MRRAQGYASVTGDLRSGDVTLTDHGKRHFEQEIDTFSCGHCNRIVHVPPRSDPADIGGLCKQCMRLICPNCVEARRCMPLEAKIEQMEAKRRFHEAVSA